MKCSHQPSQGGSVIIGLFYSRRQKSDGLSFLMVQRLKCIQVKSSLCLTVNVCQLSLCTAASEEVIQIFDNIKVDCPGNGTNEVHRNGTFVFGGVKLVIVTDLVEQL